MPTKTRRMTKATTLRQISSIPDGTDPDQSPSMSETKGSKRPRSANKTTPTIPTTDTTSTLAATGTSSLTQNTTTPAKKKRPRNASSTKQPTTPAPTTVATVIPVPVTPETITTTIRRQRRQNPVPPSSESPDTDHPTKTITVTATDANIETKNTTNKKNNKRATNNKQDRHPPKEDWQSIYQLVEELRKDRTAPVDTDGSEALPQKDMGDATFRFQVLIALMLSSQTKDAVVGDAMRKLQAHGLTLDNIRRSTSYDTLNEMIVKVGFHNTKAKNILKVAEILHTNYGDDIPSTAQEMIDELPGVGPKMAFIVENVAWGKTTGIGVDTHMHRMFNQLQWVNSTQPEQTRLQLQSWLPVEYWPTINVLWVGMGQEVQQFQDKLLRKCLDCSKPKEALKLVKRLGLDYRKVGTKMGWMKEIEAVLQCSPSPGSHQLPPR